MKDAVLELDSGWLEGMTLNTVEPSPVGSRAATEASPSSSGTSPPAATTSLFLQFKVNPTNVGRRPTDVDLYDGDTRLLHVDRTITVWP